MISIITCSASPPRFQAVCAQWKRVMDKGGEPWELIGVHDARSLCEGYTRGLASSRGELVIFAHDDIDIWTDEFVPRLRRHLAVYDAVGVAGTRKLVSAGWFDAGPPHTAGAVAHRVAGQGPCGLMIYGASRRVTPEIQAMDGVLLAFRRPVIEHVGWDAQTFTGFHFYDLDTTYRAHRAGFRLAVALDLFICHHSGGQYAEAWQRDARLFIAKHGPSFERITPRRATPMAVWMDSPEELQKVMVALHEATPE